MVIAGALVLQPRLLVADEPVASLDASVRGEILSLLLRLQEEHGLGALVITHDLGLAWSIADRIAIMYLGRIVEQGPVEQVLTAPRHPYTRALVSVLPAAPVVKAAVAEPIVLAGELPDASRIPGGCRFRPRCQEVASGNASQVLHQCTGEDLHILGPEAEPHLVACHLDRSLHGDARIAV